MQYLSSTLLMLINTCCKIYLETFPQVMKRVGKETFSFCHYSYIPMYVLVNLDRNSKTQATLCKQKVLFIFFSYSSLIVSTCSRANIILCRSCCVLIARMKCCATNSWTLLPSAFISIGNASICSIVELVHINQPPKHSKHGTLKNHVIDSAVENDFFVFHSFVMIFILMSLFFHLLFSDSCSFFYVFSRGYCNLSFTFLLDVSFIYSLLSLNFIFLSFFFLFISY